MTDVDISEKAIDIVRKSETRAGLKCDFKVADVLGDCEKINDTFDVEYDWELLHQVFPEGREKYMQNVQQILNIKVGTYLLVSQQRRLSL